MTPIIPVGGAVSADFSHPPTGHQICNVRGFPADEPSCPIIEVWAGYASDMVYGGSFSKMAQDVATFQKRMNQFWEDHGCEN